MTFEYQDLIGKPYLYASRGPDAYDCYGLVTEIQSRMGIEIPDYRRPDNRGLIGDLINGQKRLWLECPGPQEGSVVLFKLPLGRIHIGICLDQTRFIHSSESVGSVCVERLRNWQRRIVGYYCYEH